MNVLALDLGTKTGYAYRCDGKTIVSGTINLAGRRGDSGGMKFINWRAALSNLLFEVDLVAYEDVKHHTGVEAAHCYGGLKAMLLEECDRRKIPYQSFTPGQIKKHATGKGNADKMAMMSAAAHKWPDQPVIDDNHSDALWLLDLTLATNAA